jgi:DNA-binding transcriptional LysR family regulator
MPASSVPAPGRRGHGREPKRAPRTIEELAAHDAIAYGRGSKTRSWLFPDAEGRVREAPIRSRVRFDDLEAIADAAATGLGLAWLPCWLVADRLRGGALVRVLADVPGLVYDTHALWPHAPHLPSRVRAVIDALAERLPERMG